jgi:hypothetical protein
MDGVEFSIFSLLTLMIRGPNQSKNSVPFDV